MKNYLYKVKLLTGVYEGYHYDQVKAANEKDALMELVSTFRNKYEDDTDSFLNETLGQDWTIQQFWKNIDCRFLSEDESTVHKLIWLKEIDYDLETF